MSFAIESEELIAPVAHDGASFAPAEESRRYFRIKYSFGRVLAALLLIPALPVIGLLILIVRLTSRGPGIYRQVRVGACDRIFLIYKNPPMLHYAETRS